MHRQHLAVVRLVVHAGEMQRAVHDRLAQVGRVLGADHDVAELARAEGLAGLVDRERQDVRRPFLATVLRVQLGDPPGIHELHRDVTVVKARRGERKAHEAFDLGLRRRPRR